MLRIGLIGDYDPSVKAHVAIPQALALAANALGDAVGRARHALCQHGGRAEGDPLRA